MRRITAIDGVSVTLFDGLPATASRSAVEIVGSGNGSLDALGLIKRCSVGSLHQGEVLAVLAMLAAKMRLRASLVARSPPRSVKVRAGTETAPAENCLGSILRHVDLTHVL
jgi:hypothetical protein